MFTALNDRTSGNELRGRRLCLVSKLAGDGDLLSTIKRLCDDQLQCAPQRRRTPYCVRPRGRSSCVGRDSMISRYAVRVYARAFAVALSLAMLGCDEPNDSSVTSPTASTTATVRIVFMGATARRSDLPASAQACVSGVGATHTHPSWRSFASLAMQPVPPDRYEISFADVPVNTRVSFRVNDQNACEENPTGAVTRNVLANDVRLIQNTTTPGNGDEPGFAFMVSANGAISQ